MNTVNIIVIIIVLCLLAYVFFHMTVGSHINPPAAEHEEVAGFRVIRSGITIGGSIIRLPDGDLADASTFARFTNADPTNFNSAYYRYWKDAQYVYHLRSVLDGVDRDSFELFTTPYDARFDARDDNYVYQNGRPLMSRSEADELIQVRRQAQETGGIGSESVPLVPVAVSEAPSAKGLSVTAEGVFYHGRFIEEADADTVERYDISDLVHEESSIPYWRDKSHVYSGGLQAIGADPATFELFSTNYYPEIDARDANYTYVTGGQRITRAELDLILREAEEQYQQKSN